jgi:16S rRNA (cytidine1402-2'-O)-methyltransferase
MAKLFVVATPIGNLEDVTLRALRILSEVGLIAAEDTRTAGVFLRHHGLKRPLISYNDHNMRERIPQLLEHLAETDVALVTDAGTPAISDPGVELVAAARAHGFEVVTIPGPAAPIAALSVAGLRTLSFRFVGFLPRTAGDLRRLLDDASNRPETLVAFEAPGRLRKSLAVIEEVLPERRIAVCRELTKLHEETFVGTATEALAHFTHPRGEIVVLVEGPAGSTPTSADDESSMAEEVVAMRRAGLTRAQATTLLAMHYRVSRRRLYELWLQGDRS